MEILRIIILICSFVALMISTISMYYVNKTYKEEKRRFRKLKEKYANTENKIKV